MSAVATDQIVRGLSDLAHQGARIVSDLPWDRRMEFASGVFDGLRSRADDLPARPAAVFAKWLVEFLDSIGDERIDHPAAALLCSMANRTDWFELGEDWSSQHLPQLLAYGRQNEPALGEMIDAMWRYHQHLDLN